MVIAVWRPSAQRPAGRGQRLVKGQWFAALGTSAAVHLLVVAAALAAFSRQPPADPLESPRAEKTGIVEVFRVGSLRSPASPQRPAPHGGKGDAQRPPAISGVRNERVSAGGAATPNLTVDDPNRDTDEVSASEEGRAEGQVDTRDAMEPQPTTNPKTTRSQEANSGVVNSVQGEVPAEETPAGSGRATAGSGVTTPALGNERGNPLGPHEGAMAMGLTGAGSAEAPDDGVTKEVHARLIRAARDCYPPAARRFRQVATVGVGFCVSTSGAAEQLVVTASGLEVLDDAARSCLLPGAAPFPAGAIGRCYRVPVEFQP